MQLEQHPPEIAALLFCSGKNSPVVGATHILSKKRVWSGTVESYRDTDVDEIKVGFADGSSKTVFLAKAVYGQGEDTDGDNKIWETLKQAKTNGGSS